MQPVDLLQQTVSPYRCPSRVRTIELSASGDDRNGNRNHIPGALCDYAINAGHGGHYGWYGLRADGDGIAMRPQGGNLAGYDPSWTFTGWTTKLHFKDVTDGLRHTLLVGEKHVHVNNQGHAAQGDGAFHNDDLHSTNNRVAGPYNPLVPSPYVWPHGHKTLMQFGSPHSGGIVQFVLCDGSTQVFDPNMSTTALALWANRHDEQVNP